MLRLTSDGSVNPDEWVVLNKDQKFDAEAIDVPTLVHWSQAQGLPASLHRQAPIGIWIDTETPQESLDTLPLHVPVIGVYFPTFTDGRGFSLGRMLREQRAFQGELRAIGNFMQDQLFYLRRCGFDTFVVDDNADIDSMRKSLVDFSDSYQAAVDQPHPLFRRRSS